ncbi:MAG: hypothetical protein KDD89_09700, partial [Anaerolineales bacterium]|nr:hypothetical protein [Anaerolineales bacterium]
MNENRNALIQRMARHANMQVLFGGQSRLAFNTAVEPSDSFATPQVQRSFDAAVPPTGFVVPQGVTAPQAQHAPMSAPATTPQVQRSFEAAVPP